MMPRTGSYGDTPTVTRSPGTTLIRNRRIRPLSWARTSWPASDCTRYSPPLCTATTVPWISIRSSLLKPSHFLSGTTGGRSSAPPKHLVCHIAVEAVQSAHGFLDLLCKRRIVVTAKRQGRAEDHPRAPRGRHAGLLMQHAIEALEPHRHDWQPEPRSDHADARPERVDLAAHRAFTFREDQHRPALACEIADVA